MQSSMQKPSVLDTLSNTLTRKERKELLDNINRSIKISDSINDKIISKEMDHKEKVTIAKKELAQESFWNRISVWLKHKILGKDKIEIYLNSKITRLKKEIKMRMPGITGLETKTIDPKFGEEVFYLFRSVHPLIPLFKRLWQHQTFFQNLFIILLEKDLPEVIKGPTDLFSVEDMVSLYQQAGSKEEISKTVKKRIDTYIDEIPARVFNNIENKLVPFIYLKDIILFPFYDFFQHFNVIIEPDNIDSKPIFKKTSAIICMSDLEKLYYALHLALKVYNSNIIDKEVIIILIEADKKALEDDLSLTNIQAGSIMHTIENEKGCYEKINNLIETINNFINDIPLAAYIKYFKNNPYHSLICYVPSIDLRTYYRSALKIRIMDEMDMILPHVKEEYAKKETESLFKGAKVKNLKYYRFYNSIDYEYLKVQCFIHIRSLPIIKLFMTDYYRSLINETIKVVEKEIISHNRPLRDELLKCSSMMEDIDDKIDQLDLSLSPDAEDGKMFERLRVSIVNDISQRKIFNTIVVQKNREAKDILDKSIEYIIKLRKIFEELLYYKKKNSTLFKKHFFVKGKLYTLDYLITESHEILKRMENLVNHYLEMEKG